MDTFDVVIIGRTHSKKFVLGIYNENLDVFQSIGFVDISWKSKNKNRSSLSLYKSFKFNRSETNLHNWPIECDLKMYDYIYPEHCIQVATNLIRISSLHPSGFELCRVEIVDILTNKNCYEISTLKYVSRCYYDGTKKS